MWPPVRLYAVICLDPDRDLAGLLSQSGDGFMESGQACQVGAHLQRRQPVLNMKQLVYRVPILQAGIAALAVSPPTLVTACSRQDYRLHCRRASHRSASRHEADGPRRR